MALDDGVKCVLSPMLSPTLSSEVGHYSPDKRNDTAMSQTLSS